MNVEVDRLSNLADHLIHRILSFISVKHAIRISVLSSKWRYFWISMPYLYFSTDDFFTLTSFSNFVTRVLSWRNNQIKVASIKFRVCGDVSEMYIAELIRYILFQNIPLLDFGFLLHNSFEFPLSLFRSDSLKHLSLYNLKTTSTLNLPALTTLNLLSVSLCYNDNANKSSHCLFSKCANLKHLTLKMCYFEESKILEIRHPQLSDLTLENNHWSYEFIIVDTPQLKNLVIKNLSRVDCLITTPQLNMTPTLNFPALTTINLHLLSLCYDDNANKSTHCLFSNCANLKHLTLKMCNFNVSKILEIRHPQLSDLTLENNHWSYVFIIVDTPQLKNLVIKNLSRVDYVITAPKLASLQYSGYHALAPTKDNFHCLDRVDVCVLSQGYADADAIVNLFQKFQSVKFLTLNLEIIELLSSNMELISDHPSPFANLKMLKIYPRRVDLEDQDKKKANINEVTSYLLNSSPSATFTMVTREELRVVMNVKSAQNLMKSLKVRLEMEKDIAESNRAKMIEQEKARVNYQLHYWGRVVHVNKCWNYSFAIARCKTVDIIKDLKEIKEALRKLPVSNRAEMQTCFSSLCAEAITVVKDIYNQMIECDMQGSSFSEYFHELASTSELYS